MQSGGATVLSVLGRAPCDEDGFGAPVFSKLDRWSWCRVRLRLTVKRVSRRRTRRQESLSIPAVSASAA